MGPNARARYHSKNNFQYKPSDILASARGNKIKLDKTKVKKIHDISVGHFVNLYCKNRYQAANDLPDYLKPFQEPTTMKDVKNMTKSILNGTFDQ